VAPNPGPMTLTGTNTYLVDENPAYVVDPGPADERHVAAVRAEAERRGGLDGILLTHSHADHSAAS
jgi:glyoxylase-like metal-dependent hydrolase (beta-lactamase superfamily II)